MSLTRVLVGLSLCVALAGCQRSTPQPAAANANEASPAANASGGASRLIAWLPDEGRFPGWSRSEPHHFGPGNLWEHINGAAETYLTFDFQELVTLDYTEAATGVRISVELYRMNDPVGAFGIYAQELNRDGRFLPIGSEGYLSGTALYFWAGSCYGKLTSGSDHATLAASLQALATEMGSRIGTDTKRPAPFDKFPADGLVARSFKVVPKDVLGQSYLAGAFEAEYGTGKGTWKATYIPFDAPEKATAALARYKEFLAANGEVSRDLPDGSGFVGKDSYFGVVVAARSGPAVAIAAGAPSEQQGRDLTSRLLR